MIGHRNPNLIHWAGLCFTITNSLVMVLMPLYALHLDYSVLEIGVVAALPSLVQLGLRMATGVLADHIGDIPVIRFGVLSYLLATICLLVAPRFGLIAIVAVQLLTGLGRSIFWTISKVYATRLTKGGAGANISFFNGVSTFGRLLGAGGSGLLIVGIGYQATFVVVLGLAVLQSAVTFALPPLSIPKKNGRLKWTKLFRFIPRGLDMKAMALSGFTAFVGGIPVAMTSSFYTVHVASNGYDERTTGLLVAMVMVGTLGASLWAQRRLDSIADLRRVSLSAAVTTGVGLALIPLFVSWPGLTVLFMVTGFLSGLCNVISQLLVQRYSSPERRGVAMGFSTLFWTLSLLILPFVTGLIATWTSLAFAFVIIGSSLVIATIFALLRPEWMTLAAPAGRVATSTGYNK